MPVATRNNTADDAEARVCAHFHEPAWNNPVVRVIAAEDESERAPRLHRPEDWKRCAVLGAMSQALGAEAPAWLRLIAAEARARDLGVATAIFGMS